MQWDSAVDAARKDPSANTRRRFKRICGSVRVDRALDDGRAKKIAALLSLSPSAQAGPLMTLETEARGWSPERLRKVAAAREWRVQAQTEVDWTAPAIRNLLGWLVLSGVAAVGFAWLFEDWRMGLGGGVAAAAVLFVAGPSLTVRQALRQLKQKAANRRAEFD